MKRIFALALCLSVASFALGEETEVEQITKERKHTERSQGFNQEDRGRSGRGQGNRAREGDEGAGRARQGNPNRVNVAPPNPTAVDQVPANVPRDRGQGENRRGGDWGSRSERGNGDDRADRGDRGNRFDRGRNRDRSDRGDRNLQDAASLLRSVIDPRIDANVEVRTGSRDRGSDFGRRGTSRRTVTRRGPSEFAWSFGEARQRHNRHDRRDRSWYRNNYDRFALFAGGYYYWDRGYWYPAYGYDPEYSSYQFDEPIYGYNDLDPERVIINVQKALSDEGYYDGSIDGLIGPETRNALGRFQRDAGLEVSRAIDGPTLAALDLT